MDQSVPTAKGTDRRSWSTGQPEEEDVSVPDGAREDLREAVSELDQLGAGCLWKVERIAGIRGALKMRKEEEERSQRLNSNLPAGRLEPDSLDDPTTMKKIARSTPLDPDQCHR